MERFVGISEAAGVLGVSAPTLRRWGAAGKLVAEHSAGGHRRYDLAKLRPELFRAADTSVAYARVSSHDQKRDLERQKQVLELYCAHQGWTFDVVADLGSGMNDHKKGLKRLLSGILDDQVGRLVLARKDRLLRFGAELVALLAEDQKLSPNDAADILLISRPLLVHCMDMGDLPFRYVGKRAARNLEMCWR